MWIIRSKNTHRCYVGESYSRLYEDYMPEYEIEPENYSRAVLLETREDAEWIIKYRLGGFCDLEAFEIKNEEK